MNIHKSSFMKMLFFLLATLLPPPSLSLDLAPIIKQTCAQSPNPMSCMTSFHSTKLGDDPVDVILAQLSALSSLVESAMSVSARMMREEHRDDGVVQYCLDACIENYDRVTEILARAAVAVGKCARGEESEGEGEREMKCLAREVGEVEDMVGAAVSGVWACEDAFYGKGLPSPPMSEENVAASEVAGSVMVFYKKLVRRE